MDRLDFGFEVKFAESGAAGSFSGYGAVFDQVDAYGDVIAKGAFADTLAKAKSSGRWPAMLSQHGSPFGGPEDMPIGIWTAMQEDEKGLYVEGQLADTPRGQEAYKLLKMQPRPALNGLSIGYVPKEFSLGTQPGEPRRTLKKVDLWEVSLVTFPAIPDARIGAVKSGLTERIAERALRDAGFSRSEAKAIVAHGFKAMPQREAGEGAEQLADALRRLTRTIQP